MLWWFDEPEETPRLVTPRVHRLTAAVTERVSV